MPLKIIISPYKPSGRCFCLSRQCIASCVYLYTMLLLNIHARVYSIMCLLWLPYTGGCWVGLFHFRFSDLCHSASEILSCIRKAKKMVLVWTRPTRWSLYCHLDLCIYVFIKWQRNTVQRCGCPRPRSELNILYFCIFYFVFLYFLFCIFGLVERYLEQDFCCRGPRSELKSGQEDDFVFLETRDL